MSFSDFKSITIWPKEDEVRPLVFLVYGVVWFVVLLGAAWILVGFNATSHLIDNGRTVQFCSTDQVGCSDTPTGNYIKNAISFDALCDGIIVGTVTITTCLYHLQKKRQ